MRAYDAALSEALRSETRALRGVQVETQIAYRRERDWWRVTVTANVAFPTRRVGGGTHYLVRRETLWSVAEQHYGNGVYWTVIADANPNRMPRRGGFLVAAVPLRIPQIDIVTSARLPDAVPSRGSPPRRAQIPACTVMFPTLEFDVESQSQSTATLRLPGMRLIITARMKGTLKGQRAGEIGSTSFNLRTYEAELQAGTRDFVNSIKFNRFQATSIGVSSNVAGTTWQTGFRVGNDGSFAVTLAPRAVRFRSGSISYEGNIGFELEIRAIPDPTGMPVTVPVAERVVDWICQHGDQINRTAVIGGAVLVVIGTGGAILGAGGGVGAGVITFEAVSQAGATGLVVGAAL